MRRWDQFVTTSSWTSIIEHQASNWRSWNRCQRYQGVRMVWCAACASALQLLRLRWNCWNVSREAMKFCGIIRNPDHNRNSYDEKRISSISWISLLLSRCVNIVLNNTVFENHRKKSHSTLRAKRATFTFYLEIPKMVHFAEFLKTWSLRSNSVTRQVSFNRTKIGGQCQNSKIQMWHFE